MLIYVIIIAKGDYIVIKKKIGITLVVLCVIGLVFGSYKAGELAKNEVKTTTIQLDKSDLTSPKVIENTDQPKDKNQFPTRAQVANQTTSSSQGNYTNQEQPQPPSNPYLDNIKQQISDGTLVESKNGVAYDITKSAIIDKSLMVGVESYRVNYGYAASYQPKYCVIVNFWIKNISEKNYLSTYSNFVLTDSRGYTYSPSSVLKGTGDIRGEINSGKSKKGEVVFEVPLYDRIFKLDFSPGNNKGVIFNLNTSNLMPEEIFKHDAHE